MLRCSGVVFLGTAYDGPQLTKALSYISITASIMPIIAPVFGGWISFHLGLAGGVPVCSIVFIGQHSVTLCCSETLPYGKSRFEVSQVVEETTGACWPTAKWSAASYNWMSYMAELVSLSLFPSLMQEQPGLTAAEYGSLMIVPSAGLLLIGSVALNLMNGRFSTPQLMSLAILDRVGVRYLVINTWTIHL